MPHCGALTDPVHGAFNLPGTCRECGKGIRNPEPEIVMIMGREITFSAPGTRCRNVSNVAAISSGVENPNRVRNIDRRGAVPDRDLNAATEEINFCPRAILR